MTATASPRHADYEAKVATAVAAAFAYEQTSEELITDAEFDALLEEIKAYEALHEITDTEHGLFNTVGHGGAVAGNVPHPQPMPSLAKPGSKAVAEFAALHGDDLVVEPKIDGLAIRVVYRGGKLVQAVRRGDGTAGEDVTDRMADVDGLPATVQRAYPAHSGDFEVRGELYLPDAKLEQANALRASLGKAPFANARNGVAGMVNKRDATYAGLLTFAAYGTTFGPDADHITQMHCLSRMGFGTAYALLPQSVVEQADPMAAVAQLGVERPTIGFLMDGAVLKVKDPAKRRALGEGSTAPKWAVAFKYPALRGSTVLQEIQPAIGKTGRLSLRARYAPVAVDGSILEYASLHNVGWLERADIRVGDSLSAFKANDIIPQLENPKVHLRGPDSTPWMAPEACPQCAEPFDKTTELWRCNTPECSIGGRILYAGHRDCLYIKGLGPSLVEALVEQDLVRNVADLFFITEAQYANTVIGRNEKGVELRFGAARAASLMAELEKAKSQPWNRVICALAIRMTGRTMSRRLAAAFPTAEALRSATLTQLENVDGVGPGKAAKIKAGIEANAVVLDRLAEAGVNMGTEISAPSDAGTAAKVLAGKTIVVTGSMKGSAAPDGKPIMEGSPALEALARNDMNELIEAHGGKASGSVSAKTSILVAGDNTSSKWAKADALGTVEILSPKAFAKLLGLEGDDV